MVCFYSYGSVPNIFTPCLLTTFFLFSFFLEIKTHTAQCDDSNKMKKT